MSQPYIGEIRIFAGNFAPVGWNFCDGTILPIAQYSALFQLIGTTYGGDGQTTFGLPDLRGRVPVHMGQGTSSSYILGQQGGTESINLTVNQIPQHTHTFNAASGNDQNTPVGAVPGGGGTILPYIEDVTSQVMAAGSLTATGGSQPHSNQQPTLCLTFIISLFGIFPSQG